MTWLYILGTIALLLLLLCLIRVGAQAEMADGTLRLDVKIGWLRLRILPQKPPDPKKKAAKEAKKAAAEAKKAEKNAAKAARKALEKEARKGEPLSVKTQRLRGILREVEDAVAALWPPLKRALQRTRKGIRIDPLELSMTVGGAAAPDKAARLYGYLHAAMWGVMPPLEQVMDIPDPHLHVGLDFQSEDTVLEGKAGITMRIGTLLAVGFTVAVPALKWFAAWNKRRKDETNGKQDQPPQRPDECHHGEGA